MLKGCGVLPDGDCLLHLSHVTTVLSSHGIDVLSISSCDGPIIQGADHSVLTLALRLISKDVISSSFQTQQFVVTMLQMTTLKSGRKLWEINSHTCEKMPTQ